VTETADHDARTPASRSGLCRPDVLGAILHGGQARRFGSDKALTPFGKDRLIDHVGRLLAPQVARLVVVGGDSMAGFDHTPDKPVPGLGPLGGVLGALDRAQRLGFALVATVPCDAYRLPADLVRRLGEGDISRGTFADTPQGPCPVFGLWPVGLADELVAYLADATPQRSPSLRRWIGRCGARAVSWPDIAQFGNINTPDDLQAARRLDREVD